MKLYGDCSLTSGRYWIVVLAFLLATPAWARFTPEPCKNAFSVEQEIAEGKKAAQQVRATQPLLPDDSPVARYVQQLGARLVQFAPGEKWPYEFHVTNEADINAFALPGGSVFVNLATIQAAETEAQLAGVMAHEISHVALRHSTCNLTKERRKSVWLGLGQVAAGVLVPGGWGGLAAQGIGFGAQTLFLSYSRDAEKQADLMGTDILYDAGYDARGMTQFFEIIQSKYGQGGQEFLSDHPNPGNRVDYVQQEIESLPPRQANIKTSPEFASIKKQVAKMTPYTSKQVSSGEWKRMQPGATSGGTVDFKPSGQWKIVQTAQYSVKYPDNWGVAGSTDSASALVAPLGGAEGSNVTYGAIFDNYAPSQSMDLEGGFHEWIEKILQGNNGAQVVRKVEAITVDGHQARDVEIEGPSAAGGKEHDWLVGVARGDGSISTVVYISPAASWAQLNSTYIEMLKSYRIR